jgi:hypothetical protein
LEIFKREKQKKICKGHFVVRFLKSHGKVTKTTSRNSAFAVRLLGRMANAPLIAMRFSMVAHDKGQ